MPDPPVLGPDPKFIQDPWDAHPYQYSRQNPVLFWDPDGNACSLMRTDRSGLMVLCNTADEVSSVQRIMASGNFQALAGKAIHEEIPPELREPLELLLRFIPVLAALETALNFADEAINGDGIMAATKGAIIDYTVGKITKGTAKAAGKRVKGKVKKLVKGKKKTPTAKACTKGACVESCFVAGTLIHSESSLVPIEELRVGDRVAPAKQESGCVEPNVDASWRVVHLQLDNPEAPGDIYDIVVLRSGEWLADRGVRTGTWIWFEMDELPARGLAEVVSVEFPYELRKGAGCLVTATVTHFNSFILRLDLGVEGGELHLTGYHRLWSADREDWVAAAELVAGELLAVGGGTVAVRRIERLPGVQRVYNLEVATEHSYLVGSAGLWSHNAGACPAPEAGRKSGVPGDDLVPDPTAGPYKRPSGAGPTAAQKRSVQGKPCVDCGAVTPRQVADHMDPLVVEHYRTGTIDKVKQTATDAVQPHCPTCSASQGGQLGAFGRRMKKMLGL